MSAPFLFVLLVTAPSEAVARLLFGPPRAAGRSAGRRIRLVTGRWYVTAARTGSARYGGFRGYFAPAQLSPSLAEMPSTS